MTKFKQFLTESYINLFTSEDKEKYVNEVWKMLVESYKEIGGLKGSGFSSKQDIVKSLPFWKIIKKNNDVKAVIMYKDKQGRKLVALATDQTPESRN